MAPFPKRVERYAFVFRLLPNRKIILLLTFMCCTRPTGLNYNHFRKLILNRFKCTNKLIRLSRACCLFFLVIIAFLPYAFNFLVNTLSSRKYCDKEAADFIYGKGYLHYKTITSENVSSEIKVKNSFISQQSYVPFSGYPSFCILNHYIVYPICDVMMSVSMWARVHFWIYLLNHKPLFHQTRRTDRYKQGQ